MKKRILCVGDLVCDVVMPVPLPIQANAHQTSPTRRIEPGGAGNFMFAAHNMGLDVTSVGTVGDDYLGKIIIDGLKEGGIDTSGIIVQPNTTSTLVIVLVDVDQHAHVYVGNYGEGYPVAYPTSLDELSQYDGAYFLGYTFAEHRTTDLAAVALKKAHDAGLKIYFDVGPFMGNVPIELTKKILTMVDVLLATEDEIEHVADGRTGQDVYDYLIDQGIELIVEKQGHAGCRLIAQEYNELFPAFHANVVDTVGAGDCFGGAFVACHLRGMPLDQCAQVANAMGMATVVKLAAGRNAPTMSEVKAVLADHHIEIDLD
ncbi:MAG: carbohydrate kinase family protein [Anaerolineae bacterium]|nr:carbohydrate kinase family protein [Anaerolineae bacterium]